MRRSHGLDVFSFEIWFSRIPFRRASPSIQEVACGESVEPRTPTPPKPPPNTPHTPPLTTPPPTKRPLFPPFLIPSFLPFLQVFHRHCISPPASSPPYPSLPFSSSIPFFLLRTLSSCSVTPGLRETSFATPQFPSPSSHSHPFLPPRRCYIPLTSKHFSLPPSRCPPDFFCASRTLSPLFTVSLFKGRDRSTASWGSSLFGFLSPP